MDIEQKISPQHIEDHGDGTVTAFVSVTGIEDNVKDVIEPGAYTNTLAKRTPKGVWSHDWKLPISRTLEVAELPPGHPDLPKQLSNGQPWPPEAGAVKVKTEFNVKSKRGLQAYQDVQFFGNEQEWSIGYKVPEGGYTIDKKTGVRHIHELDWFEYSPVLFGAMTHARSAKTDEVPSVAQVQLAYKALGGVDVTDIFAELKKWRDEHGYGADMVETKDAREFKGDGAPDYGDEEDEDPDAVGNDEYYEDDEDDDEEDAYDYAYPDADTKTANEYDEDDDGGYEDDEEVEDEGEEDEDESTEEDDETEEKLDLGATAYIEGKATHYDTVTDAIEHVDVPMSKTDASALMAASIAFDDAIASQDKAAAEQAATELLDVLEMLAEGSDDGKSIAVAARCIADKMAELDPEPENDKGEIEYTDAEADGKTYFTDQNIEVKNVVYGGRDFGFPLETKALVRVTGIDGVKSYLGGLSTDAISALVLYTEGEDFNDDGFKSLVTEEVDSRLYVGDAELKRTLDGNCGPKMKRKRKAVTRMSARQVKDNLAGLDNYDLADLYLEYYDSDDTTKSYLEDEVAYRIESGDTEAKSFINGIDRSMEVKVGGLRYVRVDSPYWHKRGYRVGDVIGSPSHHPGTDTPINKRPPAGSKGKGGGASGAAKKAAGTSKKAGAAKKAAPVKKAAKKAAAKPTTPPKAAPVPAKKPRLSDIEEARQDRVTYWDRFTPQQRRKEITRMLSDYLENDRLMRTQGARDYVFQSMSQGTFGVVTPEEFEAAYYDQMAKLGKPVPTGGATRSTGRRGRKSEDGNAETKAGDITTEQREKWAKEGVAMEDGSYPIPNADFLDRAIQAYGRAKDKTATKAHIVKRAESLGLTDKLPEDWTAEKVVVDLTELKSLESFLGGVK